MKLTRSYRLRIYPNFHKREELRYVANRYSLYLQHFVTQLYHHPYVRHVSTEGSNTLFNQAQREARGVVDAGVAASKETNNKFQPPQLKTLSCPAIIEKSVGTSF